MIGRGGPGDRNGRRPGAGTHPDPGAKSGIGIAGSRESRETEEKLRLWHDLRDGQLEGHRFVRQAPFGPYVIDYLCRDAKLAVQIDSLRQTRDPRDRQLDNWLAMQGFGVLRFWAQDIGAQRRDILSIILDALEDRLDPAAHPGLRYQPPRPPVGDGEGC